MKTKKRVPHICKFMKTCKTLDSLYPPTMKYGRIRRKLRELLLVSEENGRKCYTPQGNAGYIYQKEKQLTQSFHIIHPYSKFCQYWETVAIIEYIIGYLVRSYLVSMFPNVVTCYQYQIPSLVADLFETTDVWLRFNIGYVDKEMQEVVLESRKVVIHTLKRVSFYMDAIVSLPLDFCIYLHYITSGSPHVVLTYCCLLKITKTYSISRYIIHMGKIYNWSDLWVCIVSTLFFNFLCSHYLTCAFNIIVLDNIPEEDFTESDVSHGSFYYYVRVFYTITCIFFGHEGNKELSNVVETFKDKLLYSFVMIVLNINSLMFNGTFLHLLAFTRSSRVLFNEMKQEVQKFLAQENLPKRVHKRAVKYLDFRFSQSYFNEEMIMETLSPPLRREVVNFLCFNLVKRPNSIFNSLPDDLVTDLCLRMRLEYFLPGDTIFKAGKKSKKIYFLYSGSVAVYSPYGKEIMHWYEGQQFGTSAFLVRAVHPVTVIALEMTEVYLLRYADFMEAVREEPEHAARVTAAAVEKITYVSELFFSELKDIIFQSQ